MPETRPSDERTVELLIDGGLTYGVIARAITNGTIDYYLKERHFTPEQIARDVFHVDVREEAATA